MSLWKKFKLTSLTRLFDCREAARAQSEALDHALPRGRHWCLNFHLLICRWCRRYGKQLRFLQDAAHQHADDLIQASPQPLPPEARDRIKHSLKSG